jgi:hypothetical protein
MIVPKWRVFKPVDEVSVLPGAGSQLGVAVSVSGTDAMKSCSACSLSVHRVADPDDRMARFLNGFDVSR